MSDMDTKNVVLITEAQFIDGHPSDKNPHEPSAKESPVHHKVWVGNEVDGWIQVPRVTRVELDLKQGELRKAVITVLLPRVEFAGGRLQ